MNTEISTVPLPAAFRQKRVLLVEDEALIRMWLADELSEAGLDVLEAEDGDHAVALIDELTSVDLLITDIQMPGRADGNNVATCAKQMNPGLPVIYISGRATSLSNRLDICDVFLPKPFAGATLMTHVRRLLRPRHDLAGITALAAGPNQPVVAASESGSSRRVPRPIT
jgi:DNA-binding response OmpR family regulator